MMESAQCKFNVTCKAAHVCEVATFISFVALAASGWLLELTGPTVLILQLLASRSDTKGILIRANVFATRHFLCYRLLDFGSRFLHFLKLCKATTSHRSSLKRIHVYMYRTSDQRGILLQRLALRSSPSGFCSLTCFGMPG